MSNPFTFYGWMSITFQIGGRDITATAVSDLTASERLVLAYSAPSFDEAADFGTIDQALAAVTDAMANVSLRIDRTRETRETAIANITTKVKDAAKALPGFQNVLQTIGTAHVRLTDVRFELDAKDLAPGGTVNDLKGSVAIGLGLDFRTANPPAEIPGIRIKLKTVTLYVKLDLNQP
jgi:ABC-type transporter Mla subunit MlaD